MLKISWVGMALFSVAVSCGLFIWAFLLPTRRREFGRRYRRRRLIDLVFIVASGPLILLAILASYLSATRSGWWLFIFFGPSLALLE